MLYEYDNSNIENYADDTTRYVCVSNIVKAISELQIRASKL